MREHPGTHHRGEDVDVNQVTLTGVVERDPFTKTCESGAMLSLTLRVTEIGPNPTSLLPGAISRAETTRKSFG